jgi:HD superfamily phosphodiesterase
MNIKRSVESAEHQFKQILEDFFISIYDEKNLPSHGIDHHRRVWNFAREILLNRFDQESEIFEHFIPKLIIACFLHDIGMSVDKGIRHGKYSRNFCIEFLKRNNLQAMDYEDLLETIEMHDRKEYSSAKKPNELFTILSAADDLDAFGFSGIFRYSEIYLIRGIKTDILGSMIIENASKRFEYFEKNFGYDYQLVQKHRDRYDILIRFFSGYNKQVPSYQFDCQKPVGYCGVVGIFIQMIKNQKVINEFFREQEKYAEDQVIQWYFNGLKSEIF